jgi:hypothetical protein
VRSNLHPYRDQGDNPGKTNPKNKFSNLAAAGQARSSRFWSGALERWDTATLEMLSYTLRFCFFGKRHFCIVPNIVPTQPTLRIKPHPLRGERTVEMVRRLARRFEAEYSGSISTRAIIPMVKISLSFGPSTPYIRYFQIVRDVLEENIAALTKRSGKSRKDIVEGIKAQAADCSAQWFSGDVPVINYQNPLCRLSYLYTVVPATANLIEDIFTNDDELHDHFKKVQKEQGTVSICAFGGGPGTELLGICKWVETTKPKEPIFLEYLLLDRVNEWLDSWMALKKQVESRFQKYYGKERQSWPIVVSGMFSAVDIKKPASLVNLGTIFDQDIYILSYLVSEIFANFEDFRNFAQQIADHSPKGSKFLFVDRKGQRWKDEIAKVAKQAGIKLSDFNDTQSSMDPKTEEVRDLGSLVKEVGTYPKLKWNAFWAVGTKK